MIRVTVELIPYGVGEPVEIGRAEIWNDLEDTLASDGSRGSYEFRIFGKRRRFLRNGRIRNWPRRSKHVWALVARVLKEGGYA